MLFNLFSKKKQQDKGRIAKEKLKKPKIKQAAGQEAARLEIEKIKEARKELKIDKEKESAKPEKADTIQQQKQKPEISELKIEANRILRSAQITEKATALENINQYVFKVFPKANKSEVAKSVGAVYAVDVEKVMMVKAPAKRKRLGRTQGWQKGYKKAIVCIKKGQSIELLPR
ncbi:MAG: 50S ribosomal protein L23 [Patescibacteria group bacterium]|nr:50S ribosomal protein L23 [Patescibacteria group bacterium]